MTDRKQVKKKDSKEKAKLRRYWSLVYPGNYVRDLVGSANVRKG